MRARGTGRVAGLATPGAARRALWLGLGLGLALCGCGDDDAARPDLGAPDAAGGLDGGVPLDGGDGLDASGPREAGPRGPRLNHDATCEPPVDAGAPPDAGPAGSLLAPGPYGVGVTTVTLVDPARARTLPVEVWYPIDRESTEGAANAYFLDTSLGTLAHLCSPARRDAPPATSGDPWPLVLFSHGFGGMRFQSFFLTEHLASHGFVVAAPDHAGNTFADFAALADDAAAAQSAVDRPLDMLFLLDRMLQDAAGLPLALDPARVAITGHSFGAWTCFETARRDPRLRVVAPLAPGFREPSSPAIAAELDRPLLVFGASADHTTPFDEEALPAYELAAPPKELVEILGAGHLDFSDLCEVEAARGFLDDGCDPTVLDPAVTRERVKVLVLAFLRRYLDGDASYEAYLEPDAVRALGQVEVWREP